jgi:hypothetical protein
MKFVIVIVKVAVFCLVAPGCLVWLLVHTSWPRVNLLERQARQMWAWTGMVEHLAVSVAFWYVVGTMLHHLFGAGS